MGNDILYKNADYYDKNIRLYTFVIELKDGTILLVKGKHENFAHLVGLQYSQALGMDRIPSKKFFTECKRGNISLNKLISNTKDANVKMIRNKNKYFVPLFEMLINGNIKLKNYKGHLKGVHKFYIKNLKNSNIAVLGLNQEGNQCIYSTIRGEHDNQRDIESFRFSSSVSIKKITRKTNDEVVAFLEKYHPSEHEIEEVEIVPAGVKIDKHLINKLDHKTNSFIHLTFGSYGKNSVQLYIAGNIIEKKLDLSMFDNEEEMITYLNGMADAMIQR